MSCYVDRTVGIRHCGMVVLNTLQNKVLRACLKDSSPTFETVLKTNSFVASAAYHAIVRGLHRKLLLFSGSIVHRDAPIRTTGRTRRIDERDANDNDALDVARQSNVDLHAHS